MFEDAHRLFPKNTATGEGEISWIHRFEFMWRDSRKYGVFLHCITQAPASLQDDILSSSHNIFCFQLKSQADQLAVGPGIEPDHLKLMPVLPVGWCVTKLGHVFKREAIEVHHIKTLPLDVSEPTDIDIGNRLGPIM